MPADLSPDFLDLMFDERAEYEKGFGTYFSLHIQPLLEKLKAERVAAVKEVKSNAKLSVPMGAALGLALVYSLFGSSRANDDGLAKVLFVAIAGLVIWTRWPLIKYRRSVKEGLMPHVVGFFGGYMYQLQGSVSSQEVANSRIVKVGNDLKGEDFVSGVHRGVAMEFCQLTTKIKGQKSSRRLYHGLFFRFALTRPITSKTVVKPQSLAASMFGSWFSSLDHVSLEDPDFEKLFEAFSDNQVDARYILTPDVMHELSELSAQHGHPGLRFSVIGQTAYLAIPMKGHFFEPTSALKGDLSIQEIHQFLEQMHHLHSLIELLNIDHKVVRTAKVA